MEIPGRVFLDTSVINLIVEYSEPIFDGYYDVDETNSRLNNDVYALYQLFLYGSRDPLEIIISPSTFDEILATKNPQKKANLLSYSSELWHYFNKLLNVNVALNEKEILLIEKYLEKNDFANFPDAMDKRLIIEALYYKCNYFCTRDWKTMLRHRDKLTSLRIKLITPFEWWCLLSNDPV